MDLNIRALVGHIIDTAITRLTDYAKNDASFAKSVASHVEACEVAENISVESLAQKLSYENLAYEIDYYNLASEIETSDVVDRLADNSDILEAIAECFSPEDIAGHVEACEVAENIDYALLATNISPEAVAGHLDYRELATHLSPLEALGAAQSEEPKDTMIAAVEGLSGKLLDAAVNKLLTLANLQVEKDLETANHPDPGL